MVRKLCGVAFLKREATRRLMSTGSKHIGKDARDAAEELVEEKREEHRLMAPTTHHVFVDPEVN